MECIVFVARGTETVAVEQGDGTYRLYGYKWFSSATDADMTFTLARVVDKQGQAVEVHSILLFVNTYHGAFTSVLFVNRLMKLFFLARKVKVGVS
jgi:hypothetical protein